MSAALGLASCQNLPNSLDSLGGRTQCKKRREQPRASADGAGLQGTKEDYARITTLEADNARLKNQLAGALKGKRKIEKRSRRCD
jgi:hypothetical protein